MARKSFYPKRAKRRRRRFRKVARRNQVARPSRVLFGNSKVVKLRYCWAGQIGNLLGVPFVQSFVCNGIWDPNIGALGGGQPRGFDQLFSMYERCHVSNSKIRVNFMPEGVSATGDHHPIICYITTSSSGTPVVLGYRDALEQRNVSSRPWNAGQGALGTTITKHFNTARHFNKVDILDDRQFANFSYANPVESHMAYWNISIAPTHATVEVPVVDIIVTIDYTCIFHDPKNPPSSD